MVPPLPPTSKAPRRRRSSDNNTQETIDRSSSSSNERNHDAAPRLATRRYRDDDARPSALSATASATSNSNSSTSNSSSRYERGARWRPSGDNYFQDDSIKRNHHYHLPPSPNSKTMTTENEIERIREMRARRQRAERQEGGEDLHHEMNHEVTTTAIGTMTSARRSSARRSSIARLDLEKSGLVRKGSGGRRRQSSASSTLEGLSNSGDEHSSITSSDTTKPVNEASKRSDIQARLAARRSKRNSGDDMYQSTVAPTRHSSETVQRSTGHSGDIPYRSTVAPTRHSSETLPHKRTTKSTKHARHSSETLHRSTEGSNEPRTSRHGQKTSPRRSSDGVRGSVANKYKEAIAKESIANPPGRRKSTDRAKATAEVQTSQSSRRSTSSGEIPNAPSVPEPYESRGSRKPIPKPEPLPSRASSTGAISERLRERREARERDRIEREKQYGLKGLSSTQAEPMQSNNKDVPAERSISRDENKSRAVKRNITACQLMISDDEVDHATGEEWSIRLCVISAMDLPSNVVPNMPLCPILKMGLVKLPVNLQHENAKEKKSATSVIMEELGDNGIEAVKSAKVRSTTHKILSKRDNGTVDFHQEYRWDNLKEPRGLGLCVELFARAVRTPSNYMLSPPATPQHEANDETESSRPTGGSGAPATRGVNRTSSLEVSGATRRGSIWNRASKKQETEMQAAEAAAAVARMLLDDNGTEAKNDGELQPVSTKVSESTNFGYDVSLRSATESLSTDMTRDVRLGSVVIPLTRLTKGKSMNRNEAVRLEQWHQLETGEESSDSGSQRRKPSVFLEISLSSSEALDDSEDEFEEEHDVDNDIKKSRHNVSFSRRKCIEALNQTGEQESKKEKPKTEDPVLEPGVVDFVAVVGCKDIGNQKNDRGMNGWVKTTPECVVMEQFPPNNEFHLKSGRKALLPEMLQWFCFPEGARLWRGTAPPSYSDLNLERNPSASYQNVASSAAAFDACLDCTTSFSWFVIASNSDEYGSSLVKTYTAVIRFYAPAPTGIDSTQDDFAQAIMGGKSNLPRSRSVKRLWVPMAICMTSNLPIIGVMEALLLRTCEELATIPDGIASTKLGEIQQAIGNIILNYQKPISGAVNCSVPFFTGDRFLLSLSPRVCLPPLPHGRAVVSAIRLLGTEGLKYLIAAVLSECKILLHSYDIAELSMVAEVITTLVYPFAWSLPYIPVLPIGMIEFVEAPLSYLLGTHSNNLKLIEPGALDDTVVFDLNKEFSSAEYSPEKVKSKSIGSKHPPPLPASIAANLSNAVYKLLHAEEQMEEEYGESDLLEQSFPRLENESLAEREFRVTVSIEICGLLRGYQDCVGPVFNRDKFLKMSPALYEERREYKIIGGRPNGRNAIAEKTKILSSRSKRFLSSLISGQNFQQFLETLDSEEATFFHEVLEIIDESASDRKPMKRSSSDEFDFSQGDKNVALLMKSLQKNEDKIPTFCVEKDREDETLMSLMFDESEFDTFDNLYHNPDDMDLEKQNPLKFMKSLLSPIEIESTTSVSDSGMQAMSMEYLEKLETTPWQYKSLFGDLSQHIKTNDKMKLREAIGERRFRAWKLARDKKSNHEEDLPFLSESTTESAKQGSALNLTTLVTSAKNDSSTLSSDTIQSRMSSQTPAQQRIAAAKSRDIIRRCLDRANIVQTSESEQLNPFMENGRDLLAEAEKALRNPSAKLFLVSILAQRSRLDNKRTRTMRQNAAVVNSASRLDHIAFDCLIRLSCAMLDSCMEYKEFEMAYRLLTNSAGFIMVQEVDSFKEDENDEFGNEQSMIVITMTSRIGLHPIFADIGVWEAVMVLHLCDRKVVKRSGEFKSYGAESDDEEEEEEVEYEAAVATLYEMVGYGIPGEELSRFAMRASQEHGWFCDDRGRQLLMLARRICIRRDQADMGGTGNTGDIDMVRKGPDVSDTNATISEWSSQDKTSFMWRDVAWCHPAAPSRTALVKSDGSDTDLDMILSVDNFMKRTPVTALASFGSSIVASGGLDGGVFLAHSITVGPRTENSSAGCDKYPKVRGIHLDWGSASRARTGSTSDGEYGVGAVSCLAAAYGDSSHDSNPSSTKDTRDAIDEIDIAESMEGSRIIAGTTAGDLRVWSVKDIYSSISMAKNEHDGRNIHTASRFKYSLRGRALSGHRGGVTCIDVPSQVYRPDSLVTGGADGLIKLWALRAPTGSRRTNASSSNEADMGGSAGQQHRGRGGDALSTLSGHAGRILCIKTAWHGDHLISGGADRTIRVWDLASSGGKCIHRLSGHFGWITNVQYWGPNTIVSASTDRSVALWDARVRSSPLFILRNHQSPISDLLVGSRTDPHMVSAAADGSIATWDFRSLSDTSATEQPGKKDCPSNGCKIVRLPSASIRHNANMQDRAVGSVNLSRDVTDPINSFLSVGSDAIMRKWNITTGNIVDESPTGHCDTITSFESYAQNHGFAAMNPTDFRGENSPAITDKGFLTSSLDGTIRMRKLVGTNDA